mgnify:CR=1 FL=1
MDRNTSIDNLTQGVFVALRKESVDRNLPSLQLLSISCLSLSARRAWIEIIEEVSKYVVKESLSARRAWIEIGVESCSSCSSRVALRKESVDRNKCSLGNPRKKPWSLSARRAWIEMWLDVIY